MTTPSDLEDVIRARYNASGDTYFSADEIYDLLYQAHCLLATQGYLIEDIDTSITTVNGTRSYDYPTYTLAIKRIEYDGKKLDPIDFREDDAITLSNSDTTSTGTPQYYSLWQDKIYLRTIPAEAKTLTIYRYKVPTAYISTTTIEIPDHWSFRSVCYVLAAMALKENNFNKYQIYNNEWNELVRDVRRDFIRKKRGDSFAIVKNIDTLPETAIGTV